MALQSQYLGDISGVNQFFRKILFKKEKGEYNQPIYIGTGGIHQMSDHIEKTIADFQEKLAEKEMEAKIIKQAINQMCTISGRPLLYSDSELETQSRRTSLRSDEFVGMPMATAARRALEIRKSSNMDPPATVREIYQSLQEGGYTFDTKVENNALRALRISLSKNTAVFYKLPSGKFGLLAWYGDKVKRRSAADSKKGDEIQIDDDSGDDDGESSHDKVTFLTYKPEDES